MNLARVLAIDAERRDERGENDHVRVGEQASVFCVLSRVVAVESIGRNSLLNEGFLDAASDRRLAGARESRKPECAAAKTREIVKQ